MSKQIISNNEILLGRLVFALDRVGLPKHGRGVALTKSTGYSSGQLSGMLRGKAPLNERFIKSVCKEYSINEIWLETGEGEILQSVSATKEAFEHFSPNPDHMTLEQKLHWLGFKTKDIRQIQEWSKLSEEEQDEELKRLCNQNLEKGRY